MASCFAKTDEDGQLLESYITHIRIVEDGAFPSSPPPLNSNPEMKKPRLIIIAVRKSGRVRMHKARENANGSFSIGKTWMLDDLTAVEVFNSVNQRNPEEVQRANLAGGKGFIVTIGKPYYWEANTPKEKQFFIASLVKIYTKYTGGVTPALIGFEPREKEAMLAGASPQNRPQTSRQDTAPLAGAASRDRSRAPSGEPPVLHKASRDYVERQGLQPDAASSRPSTRSRREDSSGSVESLQGVLPQQSLPSLRKLQTSTSQDTVNRQEDLSGRPPRSRAGLNDNNNITDRFQGRNGTPPFQPAITPDINANMGNNASAPTPAPLTLPPPDRRRPTISEDYAGPPSESDVPAPLSPAIRRDAIRLPTRSNERPSPRSLDTNTEYTREGEKAASVSPPVGTDPQEESPSFPDSPPPEDPSQPKFEDRPGLGPMIKQKTNVDVAHKFRMAANAANSFKPRAGGAAERVRMMQQKESSASAGPDGITGVVPAPSLLRAINGSNGTGAESASIKSSTASDVKQEEIPEVKVTTAETPSLKETKQVQLPAAFPSGPPPNGPSQPDGPEPVESLAPGTLNPRGAVRSKQKSEQTQKYLDSLGIDASILEGRGEDFSDFLDNYGWVGQGVHSLRADDILEEMNRELNRAQVGGWPDLLDASDARRQEVLDGLDKVIAECDDLDVLLTLYNCEIDQLAPDVAYIEAQAEGLQVQAANQKLLKAELDSLLSTISISSDQLQSLREASLESARGLEQIEGSLVILYEAMIKIDPSLSLSKNKVNIDGSLASGKTGGIGDSEIGGMRVVQEKKGEYREESNNFLRRLKPFLGVKFSAALDETRKALEKEKDGKITRRPGTVKLDPRNHDLARDMLWKYSPVMLFSREINRVHWDEMMVSYTESAKPLYQDEFREFVFAWKRTAKKATGDEADLLFTSQVEKQTEGLATTARKLTVKRSQTLAKSLRSPIGESGSRTNVDKIHDGRLNWYEVVAGIVEEEVPIILMEQNFLVEFFHASSLDQSDFSDLVKATPPELRKGGNIRQNKVMDPNRDLARTVVQSMEEIYSFWVGDLQSLIDWALKEDPLQGVGVLVVLERKIHDLETTSQEFLVRTLRTVHTRLIGLFNKFLDEQIRAIEDTKVKIKKRKGVIGFSRIFPSFSLSLETMLSSADDLDIRETVNNAYARIIRTMFECLKVIARENPIAAQPGVNDPEDKEALNYEVLLIQNMNHFVEEVDARQNLVLQEWKGKAVAEMDEHMDLYVTAMIRRPLGKLLTTLESAESVVLSLPAGTPPSSIIAMPSHSRSTFSKGIVDYDQKFVRRKAEDLKKRVEKHFGESDEPGSYQIITKVLQQCEQRYASIEERVKKISREVYDGEISLEWTHADIAPAFRR